MSGRPSSSTRTLFHQAVDHIRTRGIADLHSAIPCLLDQVLDSDDFESIAVKTGSRWLLRDQILYPDPTNAPPARLRFVCPNGTELTALLDAESWPIAHDCIARLSRDGCPDGGALGRVGRALFDELRIRHLLQAGENGPRPINHAGDVTFIGHNTVVVDSGRTRIIVDPFLFSPNHSYPGNYQPLTVRHLEAIDALVITHSHPDHFDPSSLLRFPCDVPVVVPAIERETLLASDMARRLHELGFSDVIELTWGTAVTIGDVTVSALPFYGEQPTDGDVLHPEIRNHGNTYVVSCARFSVALVADSGKDHLGDVRHVASTWRSTGDRVDAVFSGYRGWVTYPPMHLLSSVASYFLFVPRSSWSIRQRLMNDVNDAVDAAEHFGARALVPYGDGGAPWHWAIGLGARLDGSATEDANFDPFPSRVLEAAMERARTPDGDRLASAVDVLVVHPGESIANLASAPSVRRHPGHWWPYES